MTDSVVECIRSDPKLHPAEKETNITFANDTNTMRIFSANRTMVKDLWQHTDVTIDTLSVRIDGAYRTIAPGQHGGEDIVGIHATAPIGLLKLMASPRSRDVPSGIVSDQNDVSIDE